MRAHVILGCDKCNDSTIPSSTHIPTMSARTDTEATQNQLSSGITADSLGEALKTRLEASHVDIQDLSGG